MKTGDHKENREIQGKRENIKKNEVTRKQENTTKTGEFMDNRRLQG